MKRMRKHAVSRSWSWSDDWYLSRSNIGWSESWSRSWSGSWFRSESWSTSWSWSWSNR